MNVVVEELAPCKKMLRVEIDAETVKKVIEQVTSQYQKQVSIKGFRAGKVPRETVAKLYSNAIEDRAKQDLLDKGFKDAVKEQGLRIIGQPRVEDEALELKEGNAFSFNIVAEVVPTFELPEYKGLSVTLEKKTLTEDDVNKSIDILRDRMCSYKDSDKPLEEGQAAVIDYKATCDGKPLTEIAPSATRLAEAKSFWVRIGKAYFLPGFTEQLIGLKVGDKKVVSIEFPKDFTEPELSEKKADFEVEVKQTKIVELPEANDEFAKLYGMSSFDELKNRVRSDMENDIKFKEKQSIESQIIRGLLAKVSFDLPEGVLEIETKNLTARIVQQNKDRKVPDKLIEEKVNEIKANAAQLAKDNLRLDFVLGKIAEVEKLTANEKELQARVTYLAQLYKTPLPKFIKQLQENRGFAQIATEIVRGKVMELLKLHAVVKEIPATTPVQA